MVAVLPFALAAASTAVSGISHAESASYQSQVAKNNEIIAKQNEAYTAEAGSIKAQDEGLKAAQQDSNVRAGMAANGLDVGTGSAASVQQSEHIVGQADVNTVMNKAAWEDYGYRSEEINDQAQAKLDKQEAVGDLAGAALGSAAKLAASPDIEADLRGSAGSAPSDAANGPPTSLLSGPDSASSSPNYSWMQSDDPATTEDLFGGTPGFGEVY
jgi:hypothetical protein